MWWCPSVIPALQRMSQEIINSNGAWVKNDEEEEEEKRREAVS